MLGAGVEAVIAKSFAFICEKIVQVDALVLVLIDSVDERNQLNMGLYNTVISDEDFYTHAQEGVKITIDRKNKTIKLDGYDKIFSFTHTQIEDTLLEAGGIVPFYGLHGRHVFSEIISAPSVGRSSSSLFATSENPFMIEEKSGLEW